MPKRKNTPDPGNVGSESGSGAGAGTQASESQEGRTWTRGNDPEAAAQALREANRGTSGGGLNQTIPKSTPSA